MLLEDIVAAELVEDAGEDFDGDDDDDDEEEEDWNREEIRTSKGAITLRCTDLRINRVKVVDVMSQMIRQNSFGNNPLFLHLLHNLERSKVSRKMDFSLVFQINEYEVNDMIDHREGTTFNFISQLSICRSLHMQQQTNNIGDLGLTCNPGRLGADFRRWLWPTCARIRPPAPRGWFPQPRPHLLDEKVMMMMMKTLKNYFWMSGNADGGRFDGQRIGAPENWKRRKNGTCG